MPKSKKPRKKVQSQKKNQKSTGDIYIREYYQLAFNFFNKNYLNNIELEISELRNKIRSDFFIKYNEVPNSGDSAFDFLRSYLSHLEYYLKEIIQTHSPTFWIHLYRRVGLGLIVRDKETDNSTTLNLVRNFMEIAFYKYGDLDKEDLCLSTELEYNEVLDGLFYQSHKYLNFSDEKIIQYWDQYKNNKEVILKNYTASTHKKIYLLEGIAYEYWKATANMRSIAKGGELVNCKEFYWKEQRSDSLNKLISLYDKRISIKFEYLPTAKGLLTYDEIESDNNLFYTAYNNKFVPFSKIVNDKKFGDVITNFYHQSINIDNFIDSHKVLEKPFFKRRKYSLAFCLIFFKSLSDIVTDYRGANKSTNSKTLDQKIKLFSILQRSYIIFPYNKESLYEELKKRIIEYGFSITDVEDKLPKILDEYTLDNEQQSIMSIWSFGPRPLLIQSALGYFFDIAGFSTILKNLFFGIRENQTERGVELERITRNFVEKKGYTLLKDRILKNHLDQEREADLVIKVNNTIILCDCRSIEAPVDLFLGKPSTQITRDKLIQDKFEQIETLRDFIIEYPIGKNYDYSNADKIFSIAILPEPEWIPSLEKDYWIDFDKDIPKVMSIQDFFNFLDNIAKSPNQFHDSKNPKCTV